MINARSFAVVVAAVLPTAGCSTGSEEDPDGVNLETSVSAATASSAVGGGCDPEAVAAGGWVGTAIPPSSGTFVVQFRATPGPGSSSRMRPIDAVIGISNGAANDPSDLGPAIRFNANGNIDVRDGSTYAADTLLPYRFHDGPYEFAIEVDVVAHTYSVWARHLDGIGKPLTKIASQYAFAAEQQAVVELDTIDRYVSSANGSVLTCGLVYTPKATGGFLPMARLSESAQSDAPAWKYFEQRALVRPAR